MNKIYTLLILIGSAAIVYGFALPQYNNLEHLQGVINDIDSITQSITDVEQKRAELDSRYGAFTKRELEKIESSIPTLSPESLPLFLLDTRIFLDGIEFQSVDINEQPDTEDPDSSSGQHPTFTYSAIVIEEGGDYSHMPITITGTGTYEEIKIAFDKLFKWFKALQIQTVNFEGDENGMLTFQVTADMFFIPGSTTAILKKKSADTPTEQQ